MSSDLVQVYLLSIAAMFNPTLLAAVTVMMLLPNAKRLMLGYLLGAYFTAITSGLLIVFVLHGSGVEKASRQKVSPSEDIIVGVLSLAIAWVLATGRDRAVAERRREKKELKIETKRRAGKPTESLQLRMLGKGDPKVTFLAGALLSFPGVSYLAALGRIHKLDPGTTASVALVVSFCLIEMLLLELPLLGYLFSPERTQQRIDSFRTWMARRGRHTAVVGATVIGVLLIARGLITLV